MFMQIISNHAKRGVHGIDISPGLSIKDVSNLTLAGYNVSNSHAENSAKIVRMKPTSTVFRNVVNLVMKHLSMIA